MAWTDYSNTIPANWDPVIPWNTPTSNGIGVSQEVMEPSVNIGSEKVITINSLEQSYNLPGFDDGYQPTGVSNPIMGSMGGGGGGGPTRPSSGFLYPRGDN